MPAAGEHIACVADPVPAAPIPPQLDGGVPGLCDEQDFFQGQVLTEDKRTYDQRGNLLSVRNTSAGGMNYVYDDCNHLVWEQDLNADGSAWQAKRHHYGQDGLLAQTDLLFAGTCRSTAFGYLHDAQGRVSAIYDPVACVKTADITYDGEGRVSMVTMSGTSRSSSFSWFPGGAMQSDDEAFDDGKVTRTDFDLSGREIHFFGTHFDSGSSLQVERTTTWRDDGQLIEETVNSLVSCGAEPLHKLNTFDDAGRLVHNDLSFTWHGSDCSTEVDEFTTGYTYGSDGTRTAAKRYFDTDLGSEIDTFDAHGNVTLVVDPMPDGQLVTVLKRSFEGCGF